ncbi:MULTISPECIES: DinB family protein [unclassified Agarivorans]|uniref:DinB family protein n=1 Tax=unclassified Agarivorans TaxID=2636026 RepID=UPI0026E42DB4|nr:MULTISPECIES: DinB family protein [unclassified Agarivorans]MDO6686497.1 DinB family protein [Agarivorans sp. 3_MG-2023]MDO6715315.1 DinB family protein [Agarivorans sp. 2_MG-2023]
MMKQSFELMAQYNQMMNRQLYHCAAQLSDEQLKQDRQAFFGSIFGTLNHILVGDTLWLQRFAAHPSGFSSLDKVKALATPKLLDEIIHDNFAALSEARNAMDAAIVEFSTQLTEQDLSQPLSYVSSKGLSHQKHFGLLVQHFFNHQTHHRGQLSTLLSQSGLYIGISDLLVHIPEL